MTTDHPLLRLNLRVEPVHLAFLLDRDRTATQIVRVLLDQRIKESEYDYDELKQAADSVAANSDDPRAPFTDMNRTEDIFDMAAEGDDSFSPETETDTDQEATS